MNDLLKSIDDFFNVDNIMKIEVKYVPEKGIVTEITLWDKRTLVLKEC